MLISSLWPLYSELLADRDLEAASKLGLEEPKKAKTPRSTPTPTAPTKGRLMAKFLSFMKIHSLRMPLIPNSTSPPDVFPEDSCLKMAASVPASYHPNTELLVLVLQQAKSELTLFTSRMSEENSKGADVYKKYLEYLKGTCLVGTLLSYVALGNALHLRQNPEFFEGPLEWRAFDAIVDVYGMLDRLHELGTPLL